MTTRKLGSWIDGFLEYTERLPSPEIWRKWAAVGTLAGAIERKLWLTTEIGDVYPTFYIMLVGPPGSGKTLLTDRVYEMWHTLKDLNIGYSDLTGASLKDALRAAERRVVRPNCTPSILSFNSLAFAINELSVLFKGYDPELMHILTDIYDGKRFGEGRRSKDLSYMVEHPQINLIAATNPSFMNAVMPETAWDQGFASRITMIYSGETHTRELFKFYEKNLKLREALVHDLGIIHGMIGKMKFEEGAATAIEAWHMAGGPPRPDHPKLQSYVQRRTLHLLKLCLVMSAAESNDMVITTDQYNQSLGWLLEAEDSMPDIFKSFAQGGDVRVMQDLWYHVRKTQVKEKRPMIEARVYSFLQERIPAIYIPRVLDAMKSSDMLTIELVAGLGKCYRALDLVKH
jgi:hypothetical protein